MRRRGEAARDLASALLVNIVLGIPGPLFFFILWYLLVNYPLDALGVTEREPTEDDGIFIPLVLVCALDIPAFLIWIFTGVLVREHLGRLSRLKYWATALVGVLLPTISLITISEIA